MARAGYRTPPPCYCAKLLRIAPDAEPNSLSRRIHLCFARSFRGGNVIRSRLFVIALLFCSFFPSVRNLSHAQSYPETTYQGLHWRMIGPFRGGRTRAVAGVPGQPGVFFIGQVNGGVWKSND